MAIVATPAINSQLLTIKQLHWIVRDLYAAKTDEASRIIAVILLDYVAESTLKTLLSNLPSTKPKPKKDPSFPDLWAKVDELSGEEPLPLKFEIRSLHELRNLTQHRNAVPSIENVRDHSAYVLAFLRRVFSQFFELEFDDLTLASRVLDPALRAQLEAAETHLVAGRRREAVEEAAKALHKATWMAGDLAGVGHREPWTQQLTQLTISSPPGWTSRYLAGIGRQRDRTYPHTPSLFGRDDFSPAQREVLNHIVEWMQGLTEQLAETLRALAVGGDWAAYMRFRAVAPHVSLTSGPTGNDLASKVAHRIDDYSEEQATAVFHYALDQILRLQAMGALPGPQEEE